MDEPMSESVHDVHDVHATPVSVALGEVELEMSPTQPPPPLDEVEEMDVETVEAGAGVIEAQGESGGHSLYSAVANFVNSIIGAGIIGLPFAVEEGGLFLSLVLLVVCAALTAYSVRLIIALGEKMQVDEYETLCCSLLGRSGFYAISISMIMFAYGAMLSYLILIGDTLSPVLHDWTGSDLLKNRVFTISLCAWGICLPLSALKDIGKLGKTSAVSIVCVVLLCIIISIRAVPASTDLGIHEDREFGWMGLGMSADGTMSNATMVVVTANGGGVGRDCLFTAYANETNSHGAPLVTTATDMARFQGYSSDEGTAVLTVLFNATSGLLPLIYAVGSKDTMPKCTGKDKETGLTAAHQHDMFHGSFKQGDSVDFSVSGSAEKVRPKVDLSWTLDEEHKTALVALTVDPDFTRPQKDAFTFAHKSFFPAMGVISFAYVCHHSSFLVRNSLKNKADWNRVVHISIFIATGLSLLLATVGYASFQRCTRPDILNNFLGSDQAVNVARFLLAGTMFFTYPMEFFVMRQVCGSLFFDGEVDSKRHYTMTAGIFLLTLPPGLLLGSDQLGLVLEFTGGIAASMLGFIVPGALWLSFRRYATSKVSS